MLRGKKNRIFEENKLAEMTALVGAYIEYYNIHNNENGFEEYYKKNIGNERYYFRAQRKANAVFRETLKQQGIHHSGGKVKKFYRYNKKKKPKLDSRIADYFKFIMDYIENNDMLRSINISNIIYPCDYYTRTIGTTTLYTSCLRHILSWHYDRIDNLANGLRSAINPNRDTAKEVYNALINYNKFDLFYEECRKQHEKGNKNT